MPSPSALSPADAERRDALAERIAADAVGTFDLLHVYLGERLGLFAALAALGPASAGEVAGRTGLDRRYVREWLEQGAVAAILDAEDGDDPDDPEARRFALPAGHREVLLDRDSLAYATPTAISVLGTIQQLLPAVVDVFRTGGGLRFEASGDDLREGEAAGNRPMYLTLLGQAWLPAIPEVHARLRGDPPARVVDIGMGHGWSSIAMALAYPGITVDGLDLDGPSVTAAARNAVAAGVADRVRFANRTAADPALAGRYDLVTAFECLHDMSQPVAVLRAMRDLLADGGSVLIADEKADERFRAPGEQLQRNLYGWSVLHCLSSAMDGPEPAGTGTAIRPATVRRYAAEAGFGQVEIVPIEHDTWRFYRLRP
jgi:2-polyprenyl-3-methyl-5-hydroxy-6-metoxy-1,4-benzoquinol methylase